MPSNHLPLARLHLVAAATSLYALSCTDEVKGHPEAERAARLIDDALAALDAPPGLDVRAPAPSDWSDAN